MSSGTAVGGGRRPSRGLIAPENQPHRPGRQLASSPPVSALPLALAGTPLEAVAERLGDERWLLILDNLEQVIGAAADLGELLARCTGLVILATSRRVHGAVLAAGSSSFVSNRALECPCARS